MHSQQSPGVVQNWSTLQCSKQNTEQCGYDHAPVTRGCMRAQFPLPHGPIPRKKLDFHIFTDSQKIEAPMPRFQTWRQQDRCSCKGRVGRTTLERSYYS